MVLYATSGCSPDAELTAHELTGPAMGTSYSITLVDQVSEVERSELASDVTRVLRDIEQSMSTWLPDSELSTINRNSATDWIPVSDELFAVLEESQKVSCLTTGAFDITMGPLVNLWGFGPHAGREEPPQPEEVARVSQHTGYELLELQDSPPALRKRHPSLYIDLSAIAKGYAVDRLATLLDMRNLEHYLVEIGGELRAKGRNARGRMWTIAVEKPRANQRNLQRLLRIGNEAVATSGNYRNFFEFDGQRYSHTIDPRTGAPVTHNLALVTVVAPTAMMADALATGFTVMGAQKGYELAERRGIAALFVLATDEGFSERSTTALADRLDITP